MKLQSPFTYVPLSSSVQQDFCLYRFLSDFCQSDDAIEFPFAVLAVMEQIRCDLEINLLKRKVLQLIYFLLIVRVFTWPFYLLRKIFSLTSYSILFRLALEQKKWHSCWNTCSLAHSKTETNKFCWAMYVTFNLYRKKKKIYIQAQMTKVQTVWRIAANT